MAYSQQQLAWIRLANVYRLGTQRFNALLERFGTAQAVWDAPPEEVESILGKAQNRLVQDAREDDSLDRLLSALDKCAAVAVTRDDIEYPSLLRDPTAAARQEAALVAADRSIRQPHTRSNCHKQHIKEKSPMCAATVKQPHIKGYSESEM